MKLEDFVDEESKKRIDGYRLNDFHHGLEYSFDYFPLGYGAKAAVLGHIMKSALGVSEGVESPGGFADRFGLRFDGIGLSFDYDKVAETGLYLPSREGNVHLIDHDDLNMVDDSDEIAKEMSRFCKDIKSQRMDFFKSRQNLSNWAKVSLIIIRGVNHDWGMSKLRTKNEAERLLVSDGDKIIRYYETVCQDAIDETRCQDR